MSIPYQVFVAIHAFTGLKFDEIISLFAFAFRIFKANDLKMLRVGISSFFDMVTVAAKTILEFSD